MAANTSNALSNVATGVLCLCAVIVTALVVRRELGAPSRDSAKPRDIADWEQVAATGNVMGPADGRVTIIECSDFQCPYCAAVQGPLREVRRKLGADVKVVYRHFPLEQIHPHARVAAIAAECAADQGAFEAYHDALFRRQDSIGYVSWGAFAREAGITDEAQFNICVSSSVTAGRVKQDADAARALELRGTPAIIVNGLLLAGTPTASELEDEVRRALQQLD